MIILQLVIYCLIFTLMVRFSVRGGAIDGLYFYPKAVQDRAIVMKKIVPFGFRKGSGYGWRYTWHKDVINAPDYGGRKKI